MLKRCLLSKRQLLGLSTLFFLMVSQIVNSQTELNTGDIAVVGLNANNNSCSGVSTEDIVSVVFFKDITTGTTIDITDNGWERTTPGLWGNTEGTIRAVRTGGTIPAGTVVTFKFSSSYTAVVPDALWSFSSINGFTTLNMNSGGDQLYFMQGGTWTNPGSGSNNSSYTGSVLFGFNTRTTWAADGTTQQSNLYPNLGCFSMAPTGGATDFIKYTGDTSATDQKSWVVRINTPTNWTSYASCATYNSTGYDYLSGIKFRITSFFDVDAGHDSTVCASSTPFALGGTPAGGTWSGTGVSGSNFDPSISGPGTFMVTYTYNDAGCLYNDAKNITITALATTANAGSDQNVCGTSATLAGNTPVYGTGTWTLISGSGAITTPGSPTSGLTGLGVGANVFQWTVANSPCPSSSDQVTIIGTASPTTANAGTDQAVCGTSATLAGNTAAIGTGTWTLVSGSGTITNASSPTSGLTGLGYGANVFQWTIANSPCPASSDQVTINGTASPTVANAGTDQVLCGSTTNLAGNIPTNGTGTWTLVSGTGTITDPASANSGVTGLSVGVNVFQWTVANSPCPSSSDQVTITGTASPTTANAGTDQAVCGTSATLAGNTATTGTGTWTLISGTGTITDPASPNSGVTGLSVGVNVFQWTVSNDPCIASSDQVSITITSTPTIATAGADTSVCGTSVTLNGNTPADGTGMWTLVSGSGTIADESFATTTVSGLGVGANVFQWTIASPPCTPSSDQVTIYGVASPTVSNAGSDNSVCGTNATLSGNIPSVGTGTWTVISGSGTFSDASSANSTVTGLNIGPNVFEWTISNAPCVSTSSQVTITGVSSPTMADAGADTSVCGTNASLMGNIPVYGTGMWIVISGTGTFSDPSSATPDVSGLTIGPNIFEWTISNAPCPASSSQVTITGVESPTVANAGTDQLLCNNASTLNGNTPTTGNGTWTLVYGTGTITDSTSPSSGVTGLGTGINVFVWTISNAPCSSTSDTVNITSAVAVGQIANQINVLCNSDSTGSASVSMTGGTSPYSYVWMHDASDTTNTASGLPAGNYSAVISDFYGACIDTVQITITQPSALLTSITSQNISCFGLNDGILSVNVSGGVSPYSYLLTTLPAQSSGTFNGLSQGTYVVTVVDNNNCTKVLNGTIAEPAQLVVADSVINPICFNENSGSVYLQVAGGTEPYTYLWTGNISTQNLQLAHAGTYIVTVTDAHNCSTTSISTLNNPVSITITDTVLVSETNTGNIDITVTGGTSPYSYLWSNNSVTQDVSNLGNGIYTVTVTDANLCIIVDTILVDIPEMPLVIPSLFTPNGDAKNDTWEIKGIQQYLTAHIMIYNRWGDLVFEYNGSAADYQDRSKQWDGTYNGKDLPMGSFVYILILDDNAKTYNGVVSLTR